MVALDHHRPHKAAKTCLAVNYGVEGEQNDRVSLSDAQSSTATSSWTHFLALLELLRSFDFARLDANVFLPSSLVQILHLRSLLFCNVPYDRLRRVLVFPNDFNTSSLLALVRMIEESERLWCRTEIDGVVLFSMENERFAFGQSLLLGSVRLVKVLLTSKPFYRASLGRRNLEIGVSQSVESHGR